MPPEFKKAAAAHLLLRGALIVVMACLWASGHAGASCGVLALVTVLEAFVILSSSTRIFGPVITHLPAGSDGVLITIDDGPDPQTTPAMLDLLDAHAVKAVFFLIGEKARRWPELVREIQQHGHEIGNHTEHHPAGRFWCLGPGATWREIACCQETLREITGQEPGWFRAPAGHYQSFTHPALRCLNLRLMSWNCRGFDGIDPDVGRVLGRIAATVRPGGIILLHETRATSVDLLKQTLDVIRERGIKLASPDALPE
jgi:peptidoglycan/xylan/chitin deacetylase (PgdA/CDA1 family)